jgi:hypothetical protein
MADPGIVLFVDDLGKAKNLFRRLITVGVVLSMADDGRLSYDAPAGVLSVDLLSSMRAHRYDLLILIERIEERAGIREYDGGLSRADAERCPLDDVLALV